MIDHDKTARVRAAIEEELGAFRHFADLPSTEIEQMAAQITRAIGSFLGEGRDAQTEIRAA